MNKLMNWIKCKVLGMHDFEEKVYVTPRENYVDLQLVKCKNCDTKELM